MVYLAYVSVCEHTERVLAGAEGLVRDTIS